MELPDPEVFVKHLCEVAEIPLETKQELLELIEKSKEEERAAPVLCAMKYNKSLGLIRCLLEWGAHPDATNEEFEDTPSLCEAISPLDGRPRSDSLDLVGLLIVYGANVNYNDEDDNNPLGLAISRKNKEIAEILLEHGAEIENLSAAERKQLRRLTGDTTLRTEKDEEKYDKKKRAKYIRENWREHSLSGVDKNTNKLLAKERCAEYYDERCDGEYSCSFEDSSSEDEECKSLIKKRRRF